ncbi:MAG: MFS transporter, partial [Bacteroidota bacterium]
MSSRYDKRAVWSWALYDFANSSFTTLVVTFIYATYFTKFIAPPSEADAIGTALWSRGVTITAIAVAVMSPFVGALADRGGFRKLFLMITTVVCVIGTVMLYFPLPFESAAVGGAAMEALFWFVIANVFFELGGVFYNAFLPDIAPPDRIGRISGYGWGLGYIGGLVCMFLALFVFVQAEEPVFGLLTKEAGQHVRATNLLVAGWFAIFALPLFFFVKEDRSKATQQKSRIFADTVSQLKRTFTEIRDYRQVVRFLVARMIYNDGLVTVFAFGGIFAQGAFDFTTEDVLMLGIVL